MFLKRIFIVALVSLLLTSCFSSDDAPVAGDAPDGYHAYATQEFKLHIPDAWEILTPTHFTSAVPKNTLVAFRNNIKGASFTANVVVVKNLLPEEISSRDYAQAVARKFAGELTNFKELEVKEDSINVGGTPKATLFIFAEGRETPTADLKHYVMGSGVKEKNAFVVLGAFLANEPEETVEKMNTMVKSFEIK